MSTSGYMTLIIGDDPTTGPQFEFDTPIVNIGRSDLMDLQLETATVSGHHARISFREGVYILEDLKSTNGTFLNGYRIKDKPAPLSPGDQIRLGQTVVLHFGISDGAVPVGGLTEIEVAMTVVDSAGLAPASPLLPQARLVVTIGGMQVGDYALGKDDLAIGRSSDNDIMIASSVVSRYHARLEVFGEGHRLIPLPGASNPVLINHQPITTPLELQHSDTLQIGGQDPNTVVMLTYLNLSISAVPTVTDRGIKHEIKIKLDEEKLQRGVEEVTDNTFFRVLKNDAQRLKKRRKDGD